MSPRQSGKTDKALYEYLKDPENTIFISPNMTCSEKTRRKINGDKRNFMSFDNLERKLVGRRPKTLILDEYMKWDRKITLNRVINHINPERLLIFSSSDKLYRKDIFEFVKKYKYQMNHIDLSFKFFEENPHLMIQKNKTNLDNPNQIGELYFNFITDEDTVLIDSGFESAKLYDENVRRSLGDYRYKLEILNEYLYEDEDDDEKYPKMLLKYNI